MLPIPTSILCNVLVFTWVRLQQLCSPVLTLHVMFQYYHITGNCLPVRVMFQYYHLTGNCLPMCVWYFSILFPSVLPCNGKWSSYQCVWYFSILFPSVLPCKVDFSTNVYGISVYYSLRYCNVTGNCLPVCVAFQGTIPFSISMYRGMVYQCVCCISVYCSLQYYLVTGMVYQCVCVIFQYTVPFSLP